MSYSYRPTHAQNERFISKILRQSSLANAIEFIAAEFKPEQVFSEAQLKAAFDRLNLTQELPK